MAVQTLYFIEKIVIVVIDCLALFCIDKRKGYAAVLHTFVNEDFIQTLFPLLSTNYVLNLRCGDAGV